jgi:hypothetical protein
MALGTSAGGGVSLAWVEDGTLVVLPLSVLASGFAGDVVARGGLGAG